MSALGRGVEKGCYVRDDRAPRYFARCHWRSLSMLAESLTDSERAYVVGKLGEDGLSRLFGATR